MDCVGVVLKDFQSVSPAQLWSEKGNDAFDDRVTECDFCCTGFFP